MQKANGIIRELDYTTLLRGEILNIEDYHAQPSLVTQPQAVAANPRQLSRKLIAVKAIRCNPSSITKGITGSMSNECKPKGTQQTIPCKKIRTQCAAYHDFIAQDTGYEKT
eukprot:5874961-Karenia_brevis.AAC.1